MRLRGQRVEGNDLTDLSADQHTMEIRVWTRASPAGLYPWTPNEGEHLIIVPADPTEPFEYPNCGGCRTCRDGTARFHTRLDEGHRPWIAAALVSAGVNDEDAQDAVASNWHLGCRLVDACPKTPVTFDEIVEWYAVGVANHHCQSSLTAGGWTPQALHETGLYVAGLWAQAMTVAEARRWVAAQFNHPRDCLTWKEAGIAPERVNEWISDSQISGTRSQIGEYAIVSADPHEARVWWHATQNAGTDTVTGPGIAARFKTAGVPVDDLSRWKNLSRSLSTASSLAEAVNGDFGEAARAVRAVGAPTAVPCLESVQGDVDQLEQWSALKIVDPYGLLTLTALGVTPTEVTAARSPFTVTRQVECGGEHHHIKVGWTGTRATWKPVDHDQSSERISEVFGGNKPRCLTLIDAAKATWKTGAGAVTPEAALRAADTGHPDDVWRLP